MSSVARFISEMEAKGYKGWTIKGALTVLGRIFDHASRHLGWAGQNPVRQLDRDERPKADEREKRILSADELGGLLDAVGSPYQLLFRFGASTGGRLWHDRRPRPFHLLRRTRTGEDERAQLWDWVRTQLDLPQGP